MKLTAMKNQHAALKKELILYLLVGGSNTLLGWLLAWLLPLLFHTGYWLTSMIGLVIGGFYSYVLNKRFTFQSAQQSHRKTLPRFILNIGICYLLAYGMVKPLMNAMTSLAALFSKDTWTTISLLCANGVYIVLNYIGQKFFAFRHDESSKEHQNKV